MWGWEPWTNVVFRKLITLLSSRFAKVSFVCQVSIIGSSPPLDLCYVKKPMSVRRRVRRGWFLLIYNSFWFHRVVIDFSRLKWIIVINWFEVEIITWFSLNINNHVQYFWVLISSLLISIIFSKYINWVILTPSQLYKVDVQFV